VLVLGDVTVHDIRGESLDSIVELVAIEVSHSVLHEVEGPVLVVVAAVSSLVVLDRSETLLEDIGIEEGVQGVTRYAHLVEARSELTTVLLLCQVLEVLSGSKFLVALVLLVLTSNELVLQ